MARTYGGWPYNLVQLGQEVNGGTPVAATTILRGVFGGFEDDRNTEVIDEQIGQLFPAERTRITSEGITVPMPSTPITYEQFPYILRSGIGEVTATGVDPTWNRVYAFPTDGSVNDIGFTTIEIGNRRVLEDLKQIPFCWIEEFEISGESNGLYNMSATWKGQQANSLADFSAASLPDVKEAVFGNTTFYVDDGAGVGSIGTTPYPGILMSVQITVRTGLMWVPISDGNLYPIAVKNAAPEVTFNLEYELEDGDAQTSFVAQERAKYENEEIRLIELAVPGPGTRDLHIRMAAKYDRPGPYEEQDGNTTVTFEGHAVMSNLDGLAFEIEIDNGLENLP